MSSSRVSSDQVSSASGREAYVHTSFLQAVHARFLFGSWRSDGGHTRLVATERAQMLQDNIGIDLANDFWHRIGRCDGGTHAGHVLAEGRRRAAIYVVGRRDAELLDDDIGLGRATLERFKDVVCRFR
jgi:hypothetical protein